MNRHLSILAAGLLASLVVACGGGSDGSAQPTSVPTPTTTTTTTPVPTTPVSTPIPTTPVATPLTGRYLDSAVSGLQYSTATQSGTTNAAGEYKYQAGETVSFKLYGVEISNTAASQVVTPVDSVDVNLDEIINVLRFMQTIDNDNDVSNGITLPTITDAFAVNFKQSIFDFAKDTAVSAFLTKYASGRALVSVKKAVDHFGTTTAAIDQGAVLSLTGKTGTSVMTNDYCTNGLKLGWKYSFTSTGMTMVGSDNFSTNNDTVCVDGEQEPEPFNADYASGLKDGDFEFLSCGPECTYTGINRMKYGLDGDGRTAVHLSWYMPESKKIYSIKRIVSVPGSPSGRDAALTTFREVLTLD